MSSKFDQPQDEPLFMAIRNDDPEMLSAYARAAESIEQFEVLACTPSNGYKCAKLRFRDPDASERLGEDQFFFLWLSDVWFHEKERMFSGTFFEVPPEFQKWHQVGKRLGFDPEDVFDWMVIEDARLTGGFTLRVTRERLPAEERPSYDRYIGVEVYEPI